MTFLAQHWPMIALVLVIAGVGWLVHFACSGGCNITRGHRDG